MIGDIQLVDSFSFNQEILQTKNSSVCLTGEALCNHNVKNKDTNYYFGSYLSNGIDVDVYVYPMKEDYYGYNIRLINGFSLGIQWAASSHAEFFYKVDEYIFDEFNQKLINYIDKLKTILPEQLLEDHDQVILKQLNPIQ